MEASTRVQREPIPRRASENFEKACFSRYTAGSLLLLKLEIDDAVNATPVHYFAGCWGLLAPGFFARPENMRNAYGNFSRSGLFYSGEGYMLACQVLALVAITGWVALTMIPFYILIDKLGWFRVAQDIELGGLDDTKHGGSAYNFEKQDTRDSIPSMGTPSSAARAEAAPSARAEEASSQEAARPQAHELGEQGP